MKNKDLPKKNQLTNAVIQNHHLKNNLSHGCLYVVATPIGNLGDISQRAIETLQAVDLIVAEDTRHSQKLLSHFQIQKPLLSLHEHNEIERCELIANKILAGQTLALISDAGTPLISDPGYHVVKFLREKHKNIRIIPIPGPTALIAALSVSGLPTNRFCFEGFLPRHEKEKQQYLVSLAKETRTLVFYEAPHRLKQSLAVMANTFGETRNGVIARELTKTFETIKQGTLKELHQWVLDDINQSKGEIVILIAGIEKKIGEASNVSQSGEGVLEPLQLLTILLKELPIAKATSIAAKILKKNKKELYQMALDFNLTKK